LIMSSCLKTDFLWIIGFVLFLALISSGFVVRAAEGLNLDFEDGQLGNWMPRGEVSLKVVSDTAHQGDYSLLTTGRTSNWHGPSIDIKNLVTEGTKYSLSVWVKLPAGQPEDELIMTIEKNDGESNSWDRVAGPVKVGSEEWVQLKGTYTVPPGFERFTLYIESPNETLEYYIDDVVVTPAGVVKKEVEEDLQSVAEVYKDYFLIGAAVEPHQLSGEHAELLTKHFNSVTAENVMKPISLQPSEGNFTFQAADRIVEFAERHGLQVRGHTLLWHQQSPDWFFEDVDGGEVSRIKLLRRLKRHIQTLVGRYKGKVYAWDVVNEVIDPTSKETGGMRNNKWYQILGEEYIEKAFEYAREADPEARLFINDYSLASDPGKRDLMYNLVKRLKEKGVPIDGIGMQMHVNVYAPRAADVEKAIQKFASLGVEVHITELDMSVYDNNADSYDEVPEEILIRQGQRYKELFEVFKKYSDTVTNVTFWGMADDHTWLKTWPVQRNNWPLLFDDSLKAKYAYWGVVDPDKLPVLINKADIQKGTIKIDGEEDKEWSNVVGISDLGNDQLQADVKTMWDEDNLYVLAKVKDNTFNSEDSVRIYIDEKNNKTSNYETDDYRHTIKRDGDIVGYITGEAEEVDGGYLVEMSVPFINIVPRVDTEIGFDIKIYDADSDTAIAWNDYTMSQDKSTEKFGILTLTAPPVIVEAVKGTPVIDAEYDDIWDSANVITTGVWVQGSSGATAEVRTMWDENHLYIYADVTDPVLSKENSNTWEQDSIEIFIDENNHKSLSYEDDDSQYRVNFANEQSFDPNPVRPGFVTATRETDKGYVVEAAIEFLTIKAEPGKTIGFDLQVNDDQGSGSRASIAIWNDPSGNSWQNTSGLGNLMFVE